MVNTLSKRYDYFSEAGTDSSELSFKRAKNEFVVVVIVYGQVYGPVLWLNVYQRT